MDEKTQLLFYRYELQGYVVIEDILSPRQVAAINAILDERVPPLEQGWERKIELGPDAFDNYRFGAAGGQHGSNPGFLAWGQPFVDLLDHPRTMRVLRRLLGDYFRLDRIFGMRMRRGMPSGALHSDYGSSGPFTEGKPGERYRQQDQQTHLGWVVAAYNLTDSGPETGGLSCIPGSHNCRVKAPESVTNGDWEELVQVPRAPAGSVTLFSEATTHATKEWTAAHERRTLLYKYCASHLSWSRTKVLPPFNVELTRRQKQLLSSPAGGGFYFRSLFPTAEEEEREARG